MYIPSELYICCLFLEDSVACSSHHIDCIFVVHTADALKICEKLGLHLGDFKY